MNERELFIAALRIANEGERSAYLSQSCGDDPVLKKRVEALLRAHFESDDRLERPLVRSGKHRRHHWIRLWIPGDRSRRRVHSGVRRQSRLRHGDRRVSRRRETKCADRGSLHSARKDRRRRDGRSVGRQAVRACETKSCAQTDQARHGFSRCLAAIRAGASGAGDDGPSQHRQGFRRRTDAWRPAVFRDGAGERLAAQQVLR